MIGFLGNVLDARGKVNRWNHWRPTVSICQHEDFLVDEFDILHHARDASLAKMVQADIESVSPETAVRLVPFKVPDAWDFELVFSALHDFARSYDFDTDQNEYFLHITTGTHVAQICMFLLAESRHIPAKLLQTAPGNPKDPEKTTGTYRIIDLDLSKYDKISQRFHREQREGIAALKAGIDTRNKSFNRLIDQMERVAIQSTAPILLTGPTGAGKSHMARRIYELKRSRRQIAGPFVEINCATIRGDGAMSTLFGHVKGSFTGALQDRPGLLKAAHGGLLFLDEIGELGLDEQAMLLRAVEEKRFLPVGSDKETASDFQLIAGTNRSLSDEVTRGQFRDDLLARINLWSFRMPGLRERPEDIEPNLQYELEQVTLRTGQLITMNKDARDKFLRFATSSDGHWLGNFRDLGAAVTRMATFAEQGRITSQVVADEIDRLRNSWACATSPPDDTLASLLSSGSLEQLDLFDRVQLAEVIRVCQSSRSLADAGRKLFAVSRQKKQNPNDADRLRKYLARFGMKWEEVRG